MPSAPRSPPRPHRLHRINVPIHRSQHQRGIHGAAFAAELHHWRERQPDIIRPVDKVGQALGAELARIGACKAVALRRCAVRQIDAYQLTLASLVDFWERGSHGFERCSPLAGTLRLTAVAALCVATLCCWLLCCCGSAAEPLFNIAVRSRSLTGLRNRLRTLHLEALRMGLQAILSLVRVSPIWFVSRARIHSSRISRVIPNP